MIEPTVAYPDAATIVFNLPGHRVVSARIMVLGQRRIHVESVVEAGCRGCGVISRRRHSRRLQRIRDVLFAGPVDVMWVKYRFFCGESECSRQTFSEATPQVPAFSRSTARLRQSLVDAVVDSGRAAAETAVAFGVSWWLVQRALDAAALKLPDVDALAPVMLGIDEHRFRSVRFFQDPETKAWKRFEPWMSTIGIWIPGRSLAWSTGGTAPVSETG